MSSISQFGVTRNCASVVGLLLSCLTLAGAARAEETAPVLVIHSYHPGFVWTDEEYKGLRKGFLALGTPVELHVEYLDAKRHPDPAVGARLEELLRAKPEGAPYRVVVVTDNAALKFALDVRPRLFPGAAVVYCGINGDPEAVVRGRTRVTGVLERWDPAGTLRALAQMQPGVRDILVVHDHTESGLGTRSDLEEVTSEFRSRFRFHDLPTQPLEETLRTVSQLPDSWAVLLLGFNTDASGRVYDSAQTGALLANAARVPVYTMDETRFSGGVVGGSMLTGEQQGSVAAGMVARILAGEAPDAIPIVRTPVAVLRFDFLALKRFGIPAKALPEGSRVVNSPSSIYQRYPNQVRGLVAVVLALLALSAGLAVNVLHRRRAEQALRNNEESLRITLDSIGDAVIATDAAGKLVRMNPAAEALTGWTLEEARGQRLDEVVHTVPLAVGGEDETVAERGTPGPKAASSGRPRDVLSRNGVRRTVADSAAPIRDSAGGVVGMVRVLRDVTDERALQEQLRHAQRMEVVGRLAGGVAHDFNNILTGILGASQLLVEHLPEESEDRALSEELVGAALRAADLTRRLLAFSRRGPMQTRRVEVHRLVEEVVQLLSRSIDKRILIRTELAARPDTILGDPTLLQSAILNLAVNGRDAMPDGGTLTLATAIVSTCVGTVESPAGEYLSITVSDTGVGMEEAVRARLFEPYFTTKLPGKGTGLGLASVYGCVRSHRGRIDVRSALGQGSTFELLFPLLRDQEAVAPAPPEHGVRRGQGRILVVDDEEIVRSTVARMLRSLGYRAETYGDGREAVEHCRSRPGEVDLVILDLVMPRLGGREVFHLLRSVAPDVRVMLTSGFTQHEITDALLRDGAVSFLSKPFRLDELSQLVHAALGDGATTTS